MNKERYNRGQADGENAAVQRHPFKPAGILNPGTVRHYDRHYQAGYEAGFWNERKVS